MFDSEEEISEIVSTPPQKVGLVRKIIRSFTDESNGIIGDFLRLSLLIGAFTLFGYFKDIVYLIYKSERLQLISGEADLDVGTCKRVPYFSSCRKVVVHHSSQLAFALCGNEANLFPSWFPIFDTWRFQTYKEDEESSVYVYDLKSQNISALAPKGTFMGLNLKFNSLGITQNKIDGREILALGSTQSEATEAIFLLEYNADSSQLKLLKTIMFHELGVTEKVLPISKNSFYITFSYYDGWKNKVKSLIHAREGISLVCTELVCAEIKADAGLSGIAVDHKGEKVYFASRYSTDISIGLHDAAGTPIEQTLSTNLALINQGWDPVSNAGFVIGSPAPFLANLRKSAFPIKVLSFKQKTSGIVNLNSGPPPYQTELVSSKSFLTPFTDAYFDSSTNALFLASPFVNNGGLHICNT